MVIWIPDDLRTEVEHQNDLGFNINVNNDTMGGDPIHMTRKFLMIEFSFEIEPTKIFKNRYS